MQIRPLAVLDAFEITPAQHGDDRGVFMEWFKQEAFERETRHRLSLAQANCSVSRRGVLRGIHFADVPPGQAKYVTCFAGAVLDVVVDLRLGSPRFGVVSQVQLDTVNRRAVYVAEGLGHAVLTLSDEATVAYFCSEPYSPSNEHEIHPLSDGLDMPWPHDVEPVLSPKDAAAPSLAEAEASGLLPRYEDCLAWYRR